jgi:hypothetical protein
MTPSDKEEVFIFMSVFLQLPWKSLLDTVLLLSQGKGNDKLINMLPKVKSTNQIVIDACSKCSQQIEQSKIISCSNCPKKYCYLCLQTS